MRIRATFIYPPIPDRRWDWSAVDDDTYEPGCPIGIGATEQEALAAMLEQIEMLDEERSDTAKGE